MLVELDYISPWAGGEGGDRKEKHFTNEVVYSVAKSSMASWTLL